MLQEILLSFLLVNFSSNFNSEDIRHSLQKLLTNLNFHIAKDQSADLIQISEEMQIELLHVIL